MPKIMGSSSASRLKHQPLHFRHRRGHAVNDRTSDDGMSNVQLDDLRNARDRLNVVVVESVARVNGKSFVRCVGGGLSHAVELSRLLRTVSICISSSMQFDNRSTDAR